MGTRIILVLGVSILCLGFLSSFFELFLTSVLISIFTSSFSGSSSVDELSSSSVWGGGGGIDLCFFGDLIFLLIS